MAQEYFCSLFLMKGSQAFQIKKGAFMLKGA